jgi:hypothetical protein
MAQRRWARCIFAAPHQRSAHAALVLKRMVHIQKAQKSVRLSRRRISFVALCVELDTDRQAATAAMVGSAFFARAQAASFLRHKLWRIRNIALNATLSRCRRSAQVFD